MNARQTAIADANRAKRDAQVEVIIATLHAEGAVVRGTTLGNLADYSDDELRLLLRGALS